GAILNFIGNDAQVGQAGIRYCERKAGIAEGGEVEFSLADGGDLQGGRGKVHRFKNVRLAIVPGDPRLEKQERNKRGRGADPAGADFHRRLCGGRIERRGRKRDSQQDDQRKGTHEASPASLMATAADYCRLSGAARGGAKALGPELAPTLLADADKVIEITMLFAAALRVATGIKRACRGALLIVRFRGKADMGRRSVPIISDAIDPKQS